MREAIRNHAFLSLLSIVATILGVGQLGGSNRFRGIVCVTALGLVLAQVAVRPLP